MPWSDRSHGRLEPQEHLLNTELKGMEYEELLRQNRLVTLEAQRTRADIIEVFKIMKGLEGLKLDL